MRYLTILLVFFMLQGKAQDTTFHRSMQYAYIALNMADYGITVNGLNNGAVEANPFLSGVNKYELAAIKVLSTATVIYFTNKMDRKTAKWVMIGLNVFYSFIVVNNIIVLNDLD